MSRADRDAPPRRPPPPLRQLGHATAPHPFTMPAWPPRGPPIAPPFAPPRSPFPVARGGPPPPLPWTTRPRPAPPRFPIHPPIQHAPLHRLPPPPLQNPRFAPRFRPSRLTHDPDSLWLAAFTDTHLQIAPATATATDTPREPPLRAIRERLREMLSTLDELEGYARELVEMEQKISTIDSSKDDLIVARLKAQAERKRHQCEQLRDALDRLQDPTPLGLGQERYRDTLAFTKRTRKKEAYRLRQREKVRAELTIRQRLQDQEETKNEEKEVPISDGDNASVKQDASMDVAEEIPHDRDLISARRKRHRECETARKVLLALELREARRGDELMDHERQEIDEARGQAMACLQQGKRQRKRRRTTRSREKRDSATLPPPPTVPPPLPSADVRPPVLTLRDPYATDMETLIAVRRRWDFFLAPPTAHGASAIPPHFIIPPVHPTTPWARYLTASELAHSSTGEY